MHIESGIRVILDFVEGRMETAAFEQALYHDPEVEKSLEDDPDRPSGSYVGRSLYQYLLQLDFRPPGDLLDIHGALRDFLERKKIPFKPATTVDETFEAILRALPPWLGMCEEFAYRELLPRAGGRTGSALTRWLRTEFKARFRYVSSPPKWVQSPEWPIGTNGPLVFLGQVVVKEYFHDEGAVFVFHDQTSGEIQTVIQVS
jgi:hypothetical protein